MQSNSKKTVRANVLALLSHVQVMRPGESGVTRLKKIGISQGTAQRLLDDESGIRLETIDQLAKGLAMEPWQLLVPEINPSSLPVAAEHGGLSPDAMALARSLDRIEDPKIRRVAYAMCEAAISSATLPPAGGWPGLQPSASQVCDEDGQTEPSQAERRTAYDYATGQRQTER